MESTNEIAGYLGTDERRYDRSAPVAYTEEVRGGGGATGDSSCSSSKGRMASCSSKAARRSSLADSPVDVKKYQFIPMRLSEDERRQLTVLENALEVCEYTDVVDVTFSHTRKSKLSRIFESLVDVMSISSGLLLSNNLTKGEQLVGGKTLNQIIPMFKDIFEVARRHKIMNPAKMRNTYGKLMYMIMDTESHAVKNELKASFRKPILTVWGFLESKGADALHSLADPTWGLAACSSFYVPAEYETGDDDDDEESTPEMRLRHLAAVAESKAQAVQTLINSYSSASLSADDIKRVVDSISDNEAFLDYNVKPVDRIIKVLKSSFNPSNVEEPFSLQISGSSRSRKILSSFSSLYSGYSSSFTGGGSCLSHDHSTQYNFVLQTFTLWREIMKNMARLWLFADMDLTIEQYRLVDTGQGYQRLQMCPRISNEMQRVLSRVKGQFSRWVGLSVVHLGDRDVPNALVFIDKYTQVARILAPIARCIDQLPNLVEDVHFHKYVSDEWGSIGGLRLQILSDFFKHGFDGSGDDGGSCIDGRLTSAWNWCSKLHKKPYYYVFMFTGFQGFDGDWKEN